MNPSRITTPVNKEIDVWHFRFDSKIVPYTVSIHRSRDPQASERNPNPTIDFIAEVTRLDLEKAGVNLARFAPIKIKDSNINALRKRCEAHTLAMVKLDWEMVIIVGFDPEITPSNELFNERREPAVGLKFDFVIAKQAGNFFRRQNKDETDNYFLNHAQELLNGYSWDPINVHVFPYKETLYGSLVKLKDRYERLNSCVAALLRPDKIETLLEMLNAIQLPALPAPANHE